MIDLFGQGLFALVGMRHRGTEGLVSKLPNGEPLELRREPENKYDNRAVMVWARGQHIGYVSAKQNGVLAMAMDRGLQLDAKLHRSAADRWPLVEVTERKP